MLLSMRSNPGPSAMHQRLYGGAFAAILLIVPGPAQAAAALDGAALGWPWALPFIGILVTIATGPLLFPPLWHRHYGKLAFAWSVLTLGRSPLPTARRPQPRLSRTQCSSSI